MDYNIKDVEKTVAELQRRVDELERLLEGQERYDFRYNPSLSKYEQRVARVNTKAGDSFSDWQNVPVASQGDLADADVAWAEMAFGHEITAPRTINVNAGRIGTISVAAGNVTLGATVTTHYVWVRRTLADDTCVLQSGTTWPTSDATYRYYVLHAFDVDANGNATLNLVRKVMDREAEVPVGTNTGDLLYWNATTGQWAVFARPATGNYFVMYIGGTLSVITGEDFTCPP